MATATATATMMAMAMAMTKAIETMMAMATTEM
jgi:hypothetical protein